MLPLAALCVLVISGAYAAGPCSKHVAEKCVESNYDNASKACSSTYEDAESVNVDLQAYAVLHLNRSFAYLLFAVYFSNFGNQFGRPGLGKFFKRLSDDAWQETIEIINHIAIRGGEMDFSKGNSHSNLPLELSELSALAWALDSQKELAETAFHVHRGATRDKPSLHDPAIKNHLKSHFSESPAKIRELAGHTNLVKSHIAKAEDISLLDEYLYAHIDQLPNKEIRESNPTSRLKGTEVRLSSKANVLQPMGVTFTILLLIYNQ